MLKVRRDVDVVPGSKVNALLEPGIRCDEDQNGFALYHCYPLMFILIEPFPRGGLLSLGEDTLDAKVIGADQVGEHLIGQGGGDLAKQVACVHGLVSG
ncbi:hypothetical protein D3C80_934970 [compost metagenome]